VRETSDCSTVGSSGCCHVKKRGPRHSCLSVHIEQVTAGCTTWLSNAVVMKDRLYQLYRAITQLRISMFTSANPCSMGFNSGGIRRAVHITGAEYLFKRQTHHLGALMGGIIV
jgi:hypothetical protein